MKPLLTLPELTDLISNQNNGIANATRRIGKYSTVYKELWRIVVKARSNGKNLDESDFKQSTFQKLHDEGTAYDEKIIDQLLDNLRDFLEMHYYSCQVNTAIGQVKLASKLRKHGYNKPADKANKKALVLVKKETESIQHYVKSEIEKDKYYSEKEKNIKTLQISRLERSRSDFIDAFELIIEELMECRIKRYKIAASTKKELETMLPLLPEKPIPLIKVQAQAARYYLNPSVEAYWGFRNTFFENADLLKSYKSDLLLALINAIATYPNITNEMGQDYLVLFRFGIDNKLFIENGEISYLMFDNIVYISQSRGDFSLIGKAIEAFKNIISGKKSKERSLAIAKAYLEYGKKKYKAAIEILAETNRDNYLPYYLILRKYILGFKCAYEQSSNKYEAVTYMDFKEGSFRSILATCLSRKQITTYNKKNNLNFLSLLYRIADWRNPENTKESLKKQLENCNGAILEWTWLSEKIAALPLWDYLDHFKEVYDNTWSTYDALAIIKKKEAGFKKMLSRYMMKGFIHEDINKSFLNFYNLLARICDARNPRNAKRHLLKKLESYGDLIAEKKWIEEKIQNLRP